MNGAGEATVKIADAERGGGFVALGIPAPKGSTKAFYIKKLGRAVVTNDNARTRPWEATVHAAALSCGVRVQEGALSVTLEFRLPRPRGHFGKHGLRPAAPARPTVKPDLDKLVRAVLDALSGVLFRDDAQVVHIIADKLYATEAWPCGVIARWSPAT